MKYRPNSVQISGILEYACDCANGNRTVGCCSHIIFLLFQSLKTFCGLMDIPCTFSNNIYYSFLTMFQTATKSVFEVIQKKAVDEEMRLNAENGIEATHLSVSEDGSWKKRGFSSLFGISSLIGKYSGKVLDFVVKSSFCQSCANWASKKGTAEYNEWLDSHGESCAANHHGSAGKMEVDVMKEMFVRSEELLIATYYGLAIGRHSNSASNIKDAIWATFFQKCSTDKDLQHMKCPERVDSWCKWRAAEAS